MGLCTKGNAKKQEKLSPWRKLGWSQNRKGWAHSKNFWKEMNSSRRRRSIVILSHEIEIWRCPQQRSGRSPFCASFNIQTLSAWRRSRCRLSRRKKQDNGFLNADFAGGKALPHIWVSHDGPQEVHGWRCLKVRITFERRFIWFTFHHPARKKYDRLSDLHYVEI